MRTKNLQSKLSFGDVSENAPTGEFTAVFATLNVRDKDGDLIPSGAINDGAEVLVMPQHRWDDLPIGKATIYEQDGELIATGRFFTETTHGLASYQTAKAVGSLQEWSFGFNVLDAAPGEYEGERVTILKKLDVFEVSPVMIGAGVNTRTLAMKDAIPFEATELAPREQEWDGPAEIAAAENSPGQLEMMHAWVDPEGDPAAKSSYKLPHHTASGECVYRGVVAAMAALMGARGGVDIPDEDVQGVYDHLAAHYAEFDEDPPPLRESNAICPDCGHYEVSSACSHTATVGEKSIINLMVDYEAVRAAAFGVTINNKEHHV